MFMYRMRETHREREGESDANYNAHTLPCCSCLFCINEFVVECNDSL